MREGIATLSPRMRVVVFATWLLPPYLAVVVLAVFGWGSIPNYPLIAAGTIALCAPAAWLRWKGEGDVWIVIRLVVGLAAIWFLAWGTGGVLYLILDRSLGEFGSVAFIFLPMIGGLVWGATFGMISFLRWRRLPTNWLDGTGTGLLAVLALIPVLVLTNYPELSHISRGWWVIAAEVAMGLLFGTASGAVTSAGARLVSAVFLTKPADRS